MYLAVADGGRESQHILAVQFLSDPREGWAQLVAVFQFEIAAAGLLGECLEPFVRLATDLTDAIELVHLESDGVDHDFRGARLVEDIAPADGMLCVSAVSED